MFDHIQECTTWNCINSFALWLSAFGMIAISSMTLWLSVKDKLLRISSTFDYGVLPGVDGVTMNRPIYSLSFTNIGSRPVTITNYSWAIRTTLLKKTYVFTFPQLDTELGLISSKFPCELTDGKEGHIFHHRTFFSDVENSEEMLFASTRLNTWWRIFTFRILIHTSAGKSFKAKIPLRVRNNIFKQYKKGRM